MHLLKTANNLPSRVTTIVMRMTDGQTAEIGMVGREGLVGLRALVGIAALPYLHIALTSGTAYRLSAEVLRAESQCGGALHDVLMRYTQARLFQVAQLSSQSS